MISFVEYMARRQEATDNRRAGKARPWSSDSVINTFKFCSVVRDDDRTSVEAKAYILNLNKSYPQEALTATLIFRLLNRAQSLQLVMGSRWRTDPENYGYDQVVELLYHIKPLFSNAYRVMVPGGLYSREGVAKVMFKLDEGRSEFLRMNDRASARRVVEKLRTYGLGPFVAYQTMQDLRWLWGPYEDEDKWAYIGPGALRGLSRMDGNYKPMTNKERRDNAVTFGMDIPSPVQARLDELLGEAVHRLGDHITMFEIEHNLCEWDKYCRYASGETSGTKFKPKD